MIREMDGASSNLRISGHEDFLMNTRDKKPDLYILTLCFSHANNHVQGDVVQIPELQGTQILSMMYAGALLLRMGSLWTMVHRSLYAAVDAALDVVSTGLPSQEFVQKNRLIMMLYAQGLSMSRKSKKALLAKVEVLLAFCPGRWSSGRISHLCTGMCCAGQNRDLTIKRIMNLLTSIVFRALPQLPQLTRWLKTMYAIDWWLLGVSFHMILMSALCPAMGLETNQPQVLGNHFDADTFDPSLLCEEEPAIAVTDGDDDFRKGNEETFREIRGRRFRKVVSTLQNPLTRISILIYAIVLAPIRYISMFLSQCAFNKEAQGKYPPAFTWTNPARSPLTHAQQLFVEHPPQGRRHRLLECAS